MIDHTPPHCLCSKQSGSCCFCAGETRCLLKPKKKEPTKMKEVKQITKKDIDKIKEKGAIQAVMDRAHDEILCAIRELSENDHIELSGRPEMIMRAKLHCDNAIKLYTAVNEEN